jgi:hypothetical protein
MKNFCHAPYVIGIAGRVAIHATARGKLHRLNIGA